MGSLDLQYDILNDAPATASPVETNFNRLEQFINTELISRDGSVAMTAPLRLYGDPTQNNDASTKSYVDALMPLGVVMMFGGTGVPPGGKWALCNGAELETVTYQGLFNVIGNNYTTAPVAGRFNLPNLQGRLPVGPTTEDPAIVVGHTGGSRTSGLPTHSHQMDHGHPGSSSGNASTWHTHNVSINSGTESGPHDHWTSVNYFDFVVARQGGGTSDPFNLAPGPGNIGWVSQTGWANQVHTHPVNGTTGGDQAEHTHAYTTPVHSGRTAAEGEAVPANVNMPPFLCIQFIIRVA